jgi:quercetin dioxygenase-like cupin family protein
MFEMEKKIIFIMTAFAMLLLTATLTLGQDNRIASGQQVVPRGSQGIVDLPEAWFTGKARMTPIYNPDNEMTFGAAFVTFEPGARSAWHIHGGGQRLFVTEGIGWTQEWGKPKVEIRPGDVVICPAGIKHRHGASLNSPMTHIALTGPNGVEWLEKVTDAQYQGRSQ